MKEDITPPALPPPRHPLVDRPSNPIISIEDDDDVDDVDDDAVACLGQGECLPPRKSRRSRCRDDDDDDDAGRRRRDDEQDGRCSRSP